MDNIIQTLKSDIERLKKNRSVLSETDIKGKYKKAYKTLCNQIVDGANELWMIMCFHGMYVDPDDDYEKISDELTKLINEIIEQQSALRKNIKNSLLIDCDYDQALNYELDLIKIVWSKGYGTYFKRCSYQDENKIWHNTIMDHLTKSKMMWSSEYGWISEDGQSIAYMIDYDGKWISPGGVA